MGFSDALFSSIPVVGSVVNGLINKRNVDKTNKTNLDIAKSTNQTSVDIANSNNALQERLQRENNDFARSVAIEMFNLENEYNSPKAQKLRLLEAGLNPATMYGDGASAGVGDASTPIAQSSGVSPSMPSLQIPQMQVPPSPLNGLFPALESYSKVLSNISDKGLKDAETKKISLLMDESLNQAVQQTKSMELQNSINQFNLDLDRIYRSVERNSSVRKQFMDCFKIYQDGLLSLVKQDTEKGQQLLNEANERLSRLNGNVIEQTLPSVIRQSEEVVKLTIEQQKTEKAKQSSLYSDVSLNKAKVEEVLASVSEKLSHSKLTDEQAYQLRAMREDNIHMNNLLRQSKDVDMSYLRQKYHYQMEYLRKQNLLSDGQYELLIQQVSKAEKENDVFYLRMFNETLTTFFDAALKGVSIAAMR